MNAADFVQPDRLWADLMALAEITDPERPHTRRSFSDRFLDGRRWLEQRFTEAGLTCHLDDAGNLIGRRTGSAAGLGTVMSGSHSDTVPDGGRFDGILGVLCALEAARALRDAGLVLRHDLEIVDFLAEEPSDFGLSCIGSRGMAGALSTEQRALVAPWGETLAQAIMRMGGRPDQLDTPRRTDLRAFLEVHIEQGIVLEQDRLPIGAVTAIAGVTRIEILFGGRADHAGTTPMDRRQDAAVAAASVITFVSRRAGELAQSGQGHVTATCGIVEISPNASNVVPRSARIVVDIRVSERAVVEAFLEELEAACHTAAPDAHVRLERFTRLSDTKPVACDAGLVRMIGQAADRLGLKHRLMVSGAGHDAAFVARLCPAAMVFVPCRDGRSHDPEEWCTPQDAANGARVLTQALQDVDRDF
ncbi:Zn-dependent hydrolase [Gluconobacter sp. R75690]|uniref:Zn-dependent hydrolase n=1 Tax=Gluconobacter TaxID=441 RepID=UPI00188CF61E|nr:MULTISPECIES: Zn-dependent hydrolase [unclassified Gluconobacter]MBF0851356.1 Zn-dependent hydrolase [Gluconobacter sp. R75690]MBF0880163.1 Zn-dependent hydrolase [Gluconobacter sp. R75828]